MKKMKKAGCFLLAILMLICSGLTAAADSEAKHTIHITNEKTGHEYAAYQILKGDLNENKTVLSNIQWGDGVNGDSLLTLLQELEEGESENAYSACETAEDVAEVLAKYANDSEALEAFSKKAQQCLSGMTAGTSSYADGVYSIPVTGDGYYLVEDIGEIGDGDAYTKYILQVVKDVTVAAKSDAPSLEKYILEDGEQVKANSASVGDEISYVLTSKVPAMDGYEKYFFVVHDTLGEGLTLAADSVEVTIGGASLEESAFDVLTGTFEDGCTFELVLKNFIQYKEKAGQEISITYTAVLNQKAKIGKEGNANVAHVEYSNNPNVDQIGDASNPDKPGEEDVTGVTPNAIAITYTTGIEIFKVDDSEYKLPLEGAVFTLSGIKLNQVKVKQGVYTEDKEGAYYKLKDGTYTMIPAVDETEDRYESTSITYSLDTEESWETVEEEVTGQATVDGGGEVKFYGLAAGTYEITEIVAPNGYNLLKDAIEVTITLEAPADLAQADAAGVWKYTLAGAMEQEETTAAEGVVQLEVVNKAGLILPSTGGHGVTVCYIIGICLAILAIVVEMRKRQPKCGLKN